MSLRDIVQKATAQVVPKLIGPDGFAGSTVTTTRYTATKDAAGRPARTPSTPISGAAWYVREVANAHVQRVWGITSGAIAEAQVPIGTDVADNDVVAITAGDFAGNVYEIERVKRDPLGNRILIALGPTGQTP